MDLCLHLLQYRVQSWVYITVATFTRTEIEPKTSIFISDASKFDIEQVVAGANVVFENKVPLSN